MALVLGFGMLGIGSTAGLIEPAFAESNAQASASDSEGAASLTIAATSSTKVAKPTKKQRKAFRKASADFALELFGRCVADKGKNANVTIAPMSVLNALAITANGAGGKTAAQMRKVLGGGISIARLNKNLQWYNSRLTNTKKARISTANAIWYDNSGVLRIKKAFLKAAKKYYKAEVSSANFADPATVDEINGWVAEKTEGMIKKVINQLEPNNRIAIVNALYFDAEWMVPYEHGSAVKQTFTAANGKKRKVDMLHGTEHTYIEGSNVTGFIKPYAKGYSYVALLPNEGTSVKQFVATLDGDTFRSLIARAQKTAVSVALPKYSLAYANNGMEKQLKEMGITKAFARTANLRKMGTSSNGNLFLGSVIHKTKIELDEQGTKAAAVTGILVNDFTSIEDRKIVRLDRPFVYAIIDNTTKLPVFIGTVNDIK